ncbi:STAS domain-containing protein [Streptomyces sp. NPDC048636]|uniref:STAS domain-containing protein n=1 Tax=Streptomyces sp. NPDC048636 TaxID=3155762 RepID=UPI00343B3F52
MLAGPEDKPPRRTGACEPPGGPPAPPRPPAVLVLDGPVGRAEVPLLCARLGELASGSGPGPVTVDVGAVGRPDLSMIEALARLRLTARRLGRGMRLRNAGGELRELLGWAGLEDALTDGRQDPDGRDGPDGRQDPDGRDGPQGERDGPQGERQSRGERREPEDPGDLRAEPLGEPEEGEQALGVQERVEPGDPPV